MARFKGYAKKEAFSEVIQEIPRTPEAESREAALFIQRATSLHLRPENYQILLDLLKQKDFPESGLSSFKRCGEETGGVIYARCTDYQHCGFNMKIKEVHKCNNRACPSCASKRMRKIFREIMPILEHYRVSKSGRENGLQFLTISPLNYPSIDLGVEHIRDTLKKFLRRDYVKSRIKGFYYVIEEKPSGLTWNVHIHMTYYGRQLDNRIRGVCNNCRGNRLLHVDDELGLYCRSCSSFNIDRSTVKDSRLVREWQASAGKHSSVHMHIGKIRTARDAINYMTKAVAYMGKGDSDFITMEQMSTYMTYNYGRRLVSRGGCFLEKTDLRMPCRCPFCIHELEFISSHEVRELSDSGLPLHPGPPTLNAWLVSEEQAKKECLQFFDDLYIGELELRNI